ncbi:hypothetical protein CKAN_00989300 [Cinnamomum micranthum f. kanehirae]|uniref:Complex 1 LYR protein domain-containing protein n=1 Tax=Cinnamomum micranthum f. kanehirae TaxID=337451 RepID=A0A443NRS1_9MAGN|nr:hypothetical protein CKAN_00989300 [Cinnamomum micranthum f. kanehirae]
MASAISCPLRSEILSLFRSALRTARRFKDENAVACAKRIAIDGFRESQDLSDPSSIALAFSEGESRLDLARKQTGLLKMFQGIVALLMIYDLYPAADCYSLLQEGSDHPQLLHLLQNVYQALVPSEVWERPSLDNLGFSNLSEENFLWLERNFEEEEIRTAVFDRGEDKAPGLDGYLMAFLQRFWVTLKEDLVAFMNEFHSRDRMTRGRRQRMLPSIISKKQGAFVKGRLILDGVLVANECIHSRNK